MFVREKECTILKQRLMKKNDLYALISSLSAAEKKLFKEKYARNSSANFLQLFDAIVNGGLNSDVAVKEKLGDSSFVAHLHKTKHYLYENLMRVLVVPLQTQSEQIYVWQQLQYAEMLIGRNLHEQAAEILTDTLAIAEKNEDFATAIKILYLLDVAGADTNVPNGNLEKTQEQLSRLNEWTHWRTLYREQMKWYMNRGKKDTVETLPPVSLQDLPEQKLQSRRANTVYLSVKRLWFTNDPQQALDTDKQILDTLSNLKYSVIDEQGYVNAACNTGLGTAKHPEWKAELTEAIRLLQEYEPVTRLAQGKRLVHLLRLKIDAHHLGLNKSSASDLYAWITRELQSHAELLDEMSKIKVHGSIAVFFMKEKKYDEALDSIRLILNSKMARESKPIQYRVAQMYELIAHYELHHYDFLQTLLRNYQYFQKANDTFYKVEKEVLNFMKKVTGNIQDNDFVQQQKELLAKRLAELDTAKTASGTAHLKAIGWE